MIDVPVAELAIETLQVKQAAVVYRAINHPLRMQILNLLHKKSEIKVTDLYISLRIEQSVASQHLAILRQSGIVRDRRDGKNVFYSVNYKRVEELHSIAQQMIK